MKRQEYRYLCFAENGVHAIKSKYLLQGGNASQDEWLMRQCGAAVVLAVLL